jgi:hypothetical protein
MNRTVYVLLAFAMLTLAATSAMAASADSPRKLNATPAKTITPASSSAVPRTAGPKSNLAADTKVAPTIAITTPASGDTVFIGQTCKIAWASLGQMNKTVNIEALLVGSTTKVGITGATMNDGSYTWHVVGLKPGTYKLRIITADLVVTGESNAFAVANPALVNPAVEIVSPAPEGEVWWIGQIRSITWKADKLPDGAKINIDFVRTDGTLLKLGNNLANTGTFTWTVPPNACEMSVVTPKHPTNLNQLSGGSDGNTPVFDSTLKVSTVINGKTFSAERKLKVTMTALPGL